MRCGACNERLTAYESTRKHAMTGNFLDLCSPCLKVIAGSSNLPYKDRPELISDEDSKDEGLDELEEL